MKIKIFILILVIACIGGIIFFKFRGKENSDFSSQVSSGDKKSVQEIEKNTTTPTTSSTPPQEPYYGQFLHDQDRDGLSDEKEKELGLSDQAADSDKDGLDDSVEIEMYKTDPKKKDTDGDGYADGYEVLNGFNPNGPGTLNQ